MKPLIAVIVERHALQLDKLKAFLFQCIWTMMEKLMAIGCVVDATIIPQGENGLANFCICVSTV
jgi:hypothetical protein